MKIIDPDSFSSKELLIMLARVLETLPEGKAKIEKKEYSSVFACWDIDENGDIVLQVMDYPWQE